MNLLIRIVRFLFWVLVVSWSIALLRRAANWLLRGTTTTPLQRADGFGVPQDTGTSRRLVRDPVCGTHVAEEVSIPLREGSELVHFCSAECRDVYADSMRKIAANG